MKEILTIIFSCSLLSALGQVKNQTTTTFDSTKSHKQTSSIDSFTFSGLRFKVPRDCESRRQANCCSYFSDPDQLGCNNGTTISWLYMDTEEIAAGNVESIAMQIERQMKKFKKESIVCYLMDKEVTGYNVGFTTKEGSKGYSIITSGTVNGKVVFVELRSEKKITSNKDIQSTIRQILRLKQ